MNVMALDPRGAALALHRFGFGPRAGSIAAIASDPRGALLAELERPGAGRIVNAELMSAVEASRAAFEARAARQAQRITAERSKKESERLAAAAMGDEMATVAKMDEGKAADATPAQKTPTIEQQI